MLSFLKTVVSLSDSHSADISTPRIDRTVERSYEGEWLPEKTAFHGGWAGLGMELKDKEILNESDLMEFLGVSRTTLWKLRRERNLPYGRVGREYRYLKTDIIRWLKESKYEPAHRQGTFDFSRRR